MKNVEIAKLVDKYKNKPKSFNVGCGSPTSTGRKISVKTVRIIMQEQKME